MQKEVRGNQNRLKSGSDRKVHRVGRRNLWQVCVFFPLLERDEVRVKRKAALNVGTRRRRPCQDDG